MKWWIWETLRATKERPIRIRAVLLAITKRRLRQERGRSRRGLSNQGTLGPETLYPALTYGDTPAVGDLNGDGKPGIAFTAGPGEIAILYGK
jgi:hypothetical protein